MLPVDLRQFECFIAVAEEGNVSRAAARLHMTQPPLTRRIARLERSVGVSLFMRTPSGVELTEAGAVLLDRAHRIMQLTEYAIDRARLADAGQAGSLVVGYFGSPMFDAVPRLLRGFLKTRPTVSLVLERAPKNVQADAIRDGRMHLGFSRQYRSEPGLVVRRVASEPLYLALPEGHPLLKTGEAELADLREQQLVLFPTGPRPSFADAVTQLCAQAGFSAPVVREAGDVLTALGYVASAGFCSVVPRSATRVTLPGVGFVPLSDTPPEGLSCLYRADNVPALVRAFLDHVSATSSEPETTAESGPRVSI
ncbi:MULTISPECIES: LysR family transcriptional regulator [unclassified Streptomyces]|uniref:LysR family transcriptional regulator n=1 Tax=unclassified Streptomyces TaxID=2593676 RepID=UPI002DDB0802|nr:LysR family transcriptional regulator [Streptomyces sp. NBC_01761]WSC57495.1 LysR family transcriptional regulator [Streptomyces sp. NBC_01761]WSF88599.1 LysR family transcriptional regulator [Streptomyces sp. NBC_01744]